MSGKWVPTFWRKQHLHLHKRIDMRMEAVCSSETLTPTYQMTCCCNTEDHNINLHCHKNPQSYVLHIYINEFYICLKQGFSRFLCWCIIKWNLTISMYHFFGGGGTNSLRTKWAIRHWNLWQTSSKLWVNFIGNKKFEICKLKCFHSWGDSCHESPSAVKWIWFTGGIDCTLSIWGAKMHDFSESEVESRGTDFVR